MPNMLRIATLMCKSNGVACSGNWCQMLYATYKDLVGSKKSEHAWDVMHEAGIDTLDNRGFDEMYYWDDLVLCVCSEIQVTIG